MDESKNDGIVLFWIDAWELLAIAGFGSPKMEAAISSATLGLGYSGWGGGGDAEEGPWCPKSPPSWEWNPMWEVPAYGANGWDRTKLS
jgi:hypothetical protein